MPFTFGDMDAVGPEFSPSSMAFTAPGPDAGAVQE